MSYWNGMNYYNNYSGIHYGLFGLLIPFAILDLVLKGFALWKSAKKDQNIWFIALLLVNSMGILPLVYLILNRDQKETPKKTKLKK